MNPSAEASTLLFELPELFHCGLEPANHPLSAHNHMNCIYDILKDTSPRRFKVPKRQKAPDKVGKSFLGRIPSKFLDNLKKKPFKICRILLRKRLKGKLKSRFLSFNFMQEPDEMIKELVYSKYWPASEWPKDSARKFKTFTYDCLAKLLELPGFFYFYQQVMDWYFNQAEDPELYRFLGVNRLNSEQRFAFQYYFQVILPNKKAMGGEIAHAVVPGPAASLFDFNDNFPD